jgi:hypothetical protein
MAYIPLTVPASGTTWAQFQAGGITGIVDKIIAALPQPGSPTSAPTVTGTAAATGGGATGGLLAAGTYYLVVTETNGVGETIAGPESAQLTVAATNIPRYTFQTLKAGNTARSLYIGALNGSSGGPYTLYAEGITAATYDLAVAVPSNSQAAGPPTANSTTLTVSKISMLRAAKAGNLQPVYKFGSQVANNFIRGEPVTFSLELAKLRDTHIVFAVYAAAFAEAGVLVDANPGTLGTAATGIGGRRAVRTWP